MTSGLSALAILIVGSTMAQAPKSSPKEIIEKAIEARGGKDAIQRYSMAHVVAEGTMPQGDKKLPVTVETWSVTPLQQRRLLTIKRPEGDSTLLTVINKDRAWTKRDGKPAEMVGEGALNTLKEQNQHSEMLLLYPLLVGKEIELSMLEDQEKGGEACTRVLIRRKGLSDTVISFSKKTNLVRALGYSTKSKDGQNSREWIYSDYRKNDGVLLSHKSMAYVDSKLVVELETKTITAIKTPDEKLFETPK